MVKPGQSEKVTAALREMEGVKAAHTVTGMYDVIAFVEAEDSAALGQLVISKIQTIDDTRRTHTCVVI
jgi:DNA-binding Lrp family transcriptional regulator